MVKRRGVEQARRRPSRPYGRRAEGRRTGRDREEAQRRSGGRRGGRRTPSGERGRQRHRGSPPLALARHAESGKSAETFRKKRFARGRLHDVDTTQDFRDRRDTCGAAGVVLYSVSKLVAILGGAWGQFFTTTSGLCVWCDGGLIAMARPPTTFHPECMCENETTRGVMA